MRWRPRRKRRMRPVKSQVDRLHTADMLKMCRLTMSPPTESDRAGLRGVYANETQRAAANRIGLGLLCIVAGMLFCGVILLLVVLRFDDDGSWPEHLPPLPWQIWLSTALLVLESAVLHAAVTSRSARARQKAPPLVYSTPRARLPSIMTRVTRACISRLRLGRPRAGRR